MNHMCTCVCLIVLLHVCVFNTARVCPNSTAAHVYMCVSSVTVLCTCVQLYMCVSNSTAAHVGYMCM